MFKVGPLAIAGLSLPLVGCGSQLDADSKSSADRAATDRESMVGSQLTARGIRDHRVLEAMREIPRHLFVSPLLKPEAYEDSPLPIGCGQTITQPYVVAFMTEALALKSTDRALEVGTGSGYQAAVLARLCHEIYTIEIVEPLARVARLRLKTLGYKNIHCRTGDGYKGWPEAAPFDAIVVTAAAPQVPQPLIDQLAPGGRLIIPVGDWSQSLIRITRTGAGIKRETLLPVRFVPMTGEASRRH